MSKSLTFLGYSPINLPLLMDLAFESGGYNVFKILQNIHSDFNPILFTNKDYYNYSIEDIEYPLSNISLPFFLGVTNVAAKKAVHEFFDSQIKNLINKYTTLIHNTSYISPSSVIKTATLIEPMVIVSSQTEIDFGCTIKRGANIAHHNKIGAFCSINPGVVLSGNVTIEEGCTIGTGAVIRDGITIGKNTTIGMGSVVTKDIPQNCIAYGNPCKVINKFNN